MRPASEFESNQTETESKFEIKKHKKPLFLIWKIKNYFSLEVAKFFLKNTSLDENRALVNKVNNYKKSHKNNKINIKFIYIQNKGG